MSYNLLLHDNEQLKEMLPEAYTFLIASGLRHEAYSLLAKREYLTPWQKKRLNELLYTPACNQFQFLRITEDMRNDFNEREGKQ